MSSDTVIASSITNQHSPRMAKAVGGKQGLGRRIKQVREQRAMSQAEFARQFGITRSSVSQWEAELTEPTSEKLRAIARQAHVNHEWLANNLGPMTDDDDEEERERRRVPVKGYVSAGAKAHYLPLDEGDLDRVEAPANATDKTVALEIRGDSLGELYDRWLVFFDDVRSPVTSDLIGKLCVVEVEDGRIMVKKLKRQSNGLYTLLSDAKRQEPIENMAVRWAARVKTMVQR